MANLKEIIKNEEALKAIDRIVDLFGYDINGEKIKEVRLSKLCGYYCVEVRTAYGNFEGGKGNYGLSDRLMHALEMAEPSVVNDRIVDRLLVILDMMPDIELSYESSDVIISKN